MSRTRSNFYLQNSWFLRQPTRQMLKFNGSHCNSNGKLFVKELSRNQQILVTGFGHKFHHILQADSSLLHTTTFAHLLSEALGIVLKGFLSCHGSVAEETPTYPNNIIKCDPIYCVWKKFLHGHRNVDPSELGTTYITKWNGMVVRVTTDAFGTQLPTIVHV